MSQWARENPEKMAEIASLPLRDQQDALRAVVPCPTDSWDLRDKFEDQHAQERLQDD